MKADGTPVLAFYSRALDARPWAEGFARMLPHVEFRLHPDFGNAAEVDVLCAFRPPKGMVASLTGLKLFQVLGAGTDHLMDDPTIPPNVPMARLVDESTKSLMADYVLAAVLRYHREFDLYERLKKERIWKRREPVRTADRTVGVLGLGALGRSVALRLRDAGFKVRAWRNSERYDAEGIEIHAGPSALPPFFSGLDGVVCLLPLSPETTGILSERWLSSMNEGAFVVNAARGQHLNEADLRLLLDSGHLSGATLDVVEREPLADDHWLWRHPKVLITPHVATLARASTAVPFIAENVKRVLAGERPLQEVVRTAVPDRGSV